jgi:AcrR family transcriptional regulator
MPRQSASAAEAASPAGCHQWGDNSPVQGSSRQKEHEVGLSSSETKRDGENGVESSPIPYGSDSINHPTARRMVAVAKEILARDGLPALTLESVSAAAGVNKAATRYHFGNKEGLMEAVVREIVFDQSVDGRAPESPSARPIERVDAFVGNARRTAADIESFGGFFEILPHAHQNPTFRREFMGLYEEWYGWTLEWLGLDAKDVAPAVARGVGMLIAAAIDGIAVQETIFDPDYDPEPCLEAFRAVLLWVVNDYWPALVRQNTDR